MNQASTVCGVVSDCGASTGQPSAGGSAEASTPTLAQSSTPSLGSHDDAKGKMKGAGQHTKGYGPSAMQPFRSARVEGEPFREVPATPKAETLTREDSTPFLSLGGGRLSHGSLVSPKGGHAECPDTPVRMSVMCCLEFNEEDEWIWCPVDEFVNLQDVQGVEQAHEFVIYTGGSATMTEMWPREAVCAGWGLAVLHRSAAGQMTWRGSLSAPIQFGSTGRDVLGAARLTSNAAELKALLATLTWRATLSGWVRVIRIVSDSKVFIELDVHSTNTALVQQCRHVLTMCRAVASTVLVHKYSHQGLSGKLQRTGLPGQREWPTAAGSG